MAEVLEVTAVGLFLDNRPGVETTPVNELVVYPGGIVGSRHRGYVREADARTPEYREGELISNTRQWTAISPAECAAIARGMGVDYVDPAWVGANLCLSGIANLSQLPKGTKFRFPRDKQGCEAVLVVEDQNEVCRAPGKVIVAHHPNAGATHYMFPRAAMLDTKNRISQRGLIGVVEHAGIIALDAVATVELYEPRTYFIPQLS